MNQSLTLLFVCISFSLFSPATLPLPAIAAPDDQPRIEVHFYNDVQIPYEQVAAAEQVTSRVFGHAGIELDWSDCTVTRNFSGRASSPCGESSAPAGILVYFVGPLEKHFEWVDQNALGYSIIPDTHTPASMAYISYPRIQKLSAAASVEQMDLLGLAVAHEIGHLLFGSHDHANRGIMRASWRFQHLQGIAWNEFAFPADQGKRLRAAVRARFQGAKLAM